jgi:hypothetical protein
LFGVCLRFLSHWGLEPLIGMAFVMVYWSCFFTVDVPKLSCSRLRGVGGKAKHLPLVAFHSKRTRNVCYVVATDVVVVVVAVTLLC